MRKDSINKELRDEIIFEVLRLNIFKYNNFVVKYVSVNNMLQEAEENAKRNLRSKKKSTYIT